MRSRKRHSRRRLPVCAAGRLAMLVILMLAMVSGSLAEETFTALCNADVPPPLPAAHERASDDYFADAVFIGDSIMECVEMYHFFPTATILCQSGFAPSEANRRIFKTNEYSWESYNIYEMIGFYPHAKIYILLGGNTLDKKTSDTALAEYRVMIDELIRLFPESIIYVITPPSMTAKLMTERDLPVLRYFYFRNGLLELAQEKSLYFLDYYALVVDTDGYLMSRYDGGDGGHPSKKGIQVLENLVYTQTVPYPQQ